MLTGLATSIESPADLGTTEGAVIQQSTVVAGERHALRHALVDDSVADLGQAIHIGLTGAVVAAFDGVAEKALHAVAVVLVVLGRVDAALGSDAVGTTG